MTDFLFISPIYLWLSIYLSIFLSIDISYLYILSILFNTEIYPNIFIVNNHPMITRAKDNISKKAFLAHRPTEPHSYSQAAKDQNFQAPSLSTSEPNSPLFPNLWACGGMIDFQKLHLKMLPEVTPKNASRSYTWSCKKLQNGFTIVS